MRRAPFRTDPALAFEYRLAARLGRTVEELRRTMTVQEMAGWIALERREADGGD